MPQPPTRVLIGALVSLSLVAAGLWVIHRPHTDAAEGLDRPTRANSGPYVLIGAAGDVACDPTNRFFGVVPRDTANCQDAATAAILRRERVAAVLALGDVQYEQATIDEFRQSYDRTWGILKDRTYAVAGNHEYYLSSAPGYFEYFGRRGGRAGEGYYSFDIGTWHLIALNSNCTEVGCFEGSAQERFLRRDLASHANRCVLAFWHQPRFSSGPEGEERSVAPLWDALYDANADVVLNGHNHQYERFGPQDSEGRRDVRRGLRQFVVGTGGESLQRFVRLEVNSEVRIADTFGVLLLRLQPSSYAWRFVPTTPEGRTDSGHGSCH